MSDSDLAVLRPQLVAVVRARVPAPDVEDVVQATLADAVAATKKPAAPDERRAWVFGIARHKIADYHRARKRTHVDADETELPDSAPHHSERDLLRWAEGALPKGEEAKQTLEWMLREGDGEKLEEIATHARVPAPTVRKRVSRLREHLRAEWRKELALVFAAALLGVAVYLLVRDRPKEAQGPVPVPSLSALPPQEIARGLRMEGLGKCQREEWAECVRMLDRAKELDPAGDRADDVSRARAAADAARNAPSPAPSLSPVPSPSASGAPTVTPAPPPTPTSAPVPAPTSAPLRPAPRGSSATPPAAPRFGTGGSAGGSSDSL